MNLKTKGVKRVSDCKVKKAQAGRITVEDIFTQEQQVLEADTLVLSFWRKAETRLHDELEGKVQEIHLIGDALAPRRLIEAFYEGYTVAAEI